MYNLGHILHFLRFFMTSSSFSSTAAFIWSVADLLRGDFKQSQYGRIILPFTLLRRLECVLEASKDAVVAQNEKVKTMNLPEEAQEKLLLRATQVSSNPKGLSFFNTSPMDLGKMGQSDIKANLEHYIQCFSLDAREIFEHFKFDEFVGSLNEANLLYKVVKKFATTDLSPNAISNYEMGLVFEELIRRFAEGSNETAGEHFTPRDIVQLTTSLVFMEDDNALSKDGTIRTIYDPTAGTGGFLSSGMEYVYEHNQSARMVAFGQELNPESYAICKADMLIKGQEVKNIKLGNTLSNDQLPTEKFDYMLSNPPFGVDWKKIEGDIKDEHQVKGFAGRFGAGLPRVSDGSLLFLMHLLSKMRDSSSSAAGASSTTDTANGGRIGIILNGSPLFTGGAGSGESEIRRYILESDLLEAIVALPTDMFYNTGIATYVWILSNKKEAQRKGKVQLIDGSNLYGKMRKSLGSKRNLMSADDIKTITRAFGDFAVIDAQELDKPVEQKSNRGRQSATPKSTAPKTFASKLFDSTDFGYRRLTIERPLRLSAQVTDDAVQSLRFAPKPFNAVMQSVYNDFGFAWTEENYGSLMDNEAELRAMFKADFPELKEKQIKDLLDSKVWLFQKSLMEKATQLQAELGNEQSDDFNQFDLELKEALKATDIKLDTKEKKQFLDAVTWKNPEAEPLVKKVVKSASQPLYGAFCYSGSLKSYQGKVVEYQTDGDLRDNENVPLDPTITNVELIETYFKKEVAPHVADAWINADKRDAKDNEIGIVGYEIPFNRHFYQYQPPRDLAEIDADLDAVSADIMKLLQEVHS
jgi:type I restriction enzyme M protein